MNISQFDHLFFCIFGWFQVLAVMNKAFLDFQLQVFLWTYFHFSCYVIWNMFNFIKNCQMFFKVVELYTLLTRMYESQNCSRVWQYLVWSVCNCSHSNVHIVWFLLEFPWWLRVLNVFQLLSGCLTILFWKMSV